MAALPLTPSPADQSVDLIGQIFGSNWQHLLDGGASGGGGGATQTIIPNGGSLFGDMFLVANSIALAIAGLLIVYTVVVGAMSTAHEGESLGRRFHTLWAPVRSAFAIALLMPLAGGYSLLQAGILYFASMGIGVADQVWDKGLSYIASSQGVIVSPPTSRVDNLANGVLKSLVCQGYLNKQAVNYDLQSMITMKQTATIDKSIIAFDGAPGSGLGAGACGQITIACQAGDGTGTSLAQPICAAQQEGANKLIALLRPVADQIVADQVPAPNQIESAVTGYQSDLKAGIATAVAQANGQRSAQIAEFVAKAQSQGWASAGSWYWTISRLNQQIASAASALPVYSGPVDAPQSDMDLGARLAAVDGYIRTHGSPIGTPSSQLAQAGSSDGNGVGATLRDMSQALAGITLAHALEPGSDPIAQMQALGNVTLDATGGVIAAVAGGSMLKKFTGIGKAAMAARAGDGVVGKMLGAVGTAISGTISLIPIVIMLAFSLVTLGMLLAYYLPSVPFILWTLGVVGYLILLVEALVAAPLWAIGHAIPEGEGMAGQHGKQGYMLFLNVIARPALMVFGYFAAVLIMWGVAGWIGKGYQTFTAGLQAETFTGIFGLIAMLAVLAGLMIAVAHMAFGLIHEVPDRVLRWIGGSGAQLGESGGESKASQGFTAVGGIVQSSRPPHGATGRPDAPRSPKGKGGGGADEQPHQPGEAPGRTVAPRAQAARSDEAGHQPGDTPGRDGQATTPRT